MEWFTLESYKNGRLVNRYEFSILETEELYALRDKLTAAGLDTLIRCE
jgi:hypothetical protein